MTNTQKNPEPKKVRLVVISNDILRKDQEFRHHNSRRYGNGIVEPDFGKPGELTVFTGAVRNGLGNQFRNADSILLQAGYKRDTMEELYNSVLIPDIHPKRKPREHELRSFVPVLPVANSEELKAKFPNAEIIIVDSISKLKKEYKDAVENNMKAILEAKVAVEERIKTVETKKVLRKKPVTRGRSDSASLGR